MPKVIINTHGSLDFVVNGKNHSVKVDSIVSEDAGIVSKTKTVDVFSKYSSKKSVIAKCKTADVELAK